MIIILLATSSAAFRWADNNFKPGCLQPAKGLHQTKTTLKTTKLKQLSKLTRIKLENKQTRFKHIRVDCLLVVVDVVVITVVDVFAVALPVVLAAVVVSVIGVTLRYSTAEEFFANLKVLMRLHRFSR